LVFNAINHESIERICVPVGKKLAGMIAAGKRSDVTEQPAGCFLFPRIKAAHPCL
jgi:hypothetical protein